MEIHVDVHALKVNLKRIRNLSNPMATISSVMPIMLTNIVGNFGSLATNHKVFNHIKCKIMCSEVFLLYIAMKSVFIYNFCTILCRLHSFLSFQNATRRLDVIL